MDDEAKDVAVLDDADGSAADESAADQCFIKEKLASAGMDEAAVKGKMLNKLQDVLQRTGAYKDFILKRMQSAPPPAAKQTRKRKAASQPTVSRKSERLTSSQRESVSVDAASPVKTARRGRKANTKEPAVVPAEEPTAAVDCDGQRLRFLTGGELRPYQVEGVEWLNSLYMNGVNGILADEMGLGKTIQVIAFACHLFEVGSGERPLLVIGPLATLPNWRSEFAQFAPQLPCLLYHGNRVERAELRGRIAKPFYLDGRRVGPVVITSYEQCQFLFAVLDEAHRIKNSKCRLHAALRQMDVKHRLLLTGTPLQNNLTELWSLFNYLMPSLFHDHDWFVGFFDLSSVTSGRDAADELIAREEEHKMVTKLHEILGAFMLRRLKADVELSVPPKKEILLFAPLTPIQRDLYEKAVNRTLARHYGCADSAIEGESLIVTGKRQSKQLFDAALVRRYLDEDVSEDDLYDVENVPPPLRSAASSAAPTATGRNLNSLKSMMVTLRKVTMHPHLLECPLDDAKQYVVDERIVLESGKMMLLDRLLAALFARGHKVLIFSQWVQMLDIVHDYCNYRRYNVCRLDGRMGLEARAEQMAKFNKDADVFAFLVSTRAGGLGVNLTAADTVILFDSDWNPQADLQAQDRCHRIGQTRPVVVYRFMAKGTIDEEMVRRAGQKRRLEKMIIHTDKYKLKESAPVDAQELLRLLRSTDFAKVVTSSADALSDADLDEILDRSSLVAPAASSSAAFEVVRRSSASTLV